ncbi:hypothetical protein ACF3NS_01245 [Arsenicicoccus cauae]
MHGTRAIDITIAGKEGNTVYVVPPNQSALIQLPTPQATSKP